MKEKIANFLIWLYTKLIGRQPCIVYRRPYKYTNQVDGFQNNCPFCSVDVGDIVYQTKYWYVIYNRYPYPRFKKHYLAIPKRHVVKYRDLTNTEMLDLQRLLDHCMSAGMLLLGRQFGSNKDASVAHLHLHLMK